MPPTPSQAPDQPKPSRPIPAATWVLGALGIAALGTGIAMWVVGLGERSDLYNAPCSQTHTCAQSAIDSSHTKLVIGDIAFGAGLVALGAATWIAVTSRPAEAPSNGHVEVRPLTGGAYVSYGAGF
jgi:hypothetical protein